MKNIRNFEGWRAEEIAKVFLLNTRLVDIFLDQSHSLDFIAVGKDKQEKRIGIEVKATKYSKTEIMKRFNKTRSSLAERSMPIILMFIDYDNEKGFYQLINKGQIESIKVLDRVKFNEDISKLLA